MNVLLLLVAISQVATGNLAVESRTITQDGGNWNIDYRLQNRGKTGIIIVADDLRVKNEGWVSNSRVHSHTLPRWTSVTSHPFLSKNPELIETCEIISAADETGRCKERMSISVQNDEDKVDLAEWGKTVTYTKDLAVSVRPNGIVRVRIRLEHMHILYGFYDPLLGDRTLKLRIGDSEFVDLIRLQEQYVAYPKFEIKVPPERLDKSYAISGPDSLHLESSVPGHQYYRFPEIPVRYSSSMRLRFYYLIAHGTDGECKIKVSQYKETPVSWRQLSGGGFEQCLKTVGRWVKVDRLIRMEAEATTLTIEFKIVGDTEVGDMWVDDVSLEIVGANSTGP